MFGTSLDKDANFTSVKGKEVGINQPLGSSCKTRTTINSHVILMSIDPSEAFKKTIKAGARAVGSASPHEAIGETGEPHCLPVTDSYGSTINGILAGNYKLLFSIKPSVYSTRAGNG